MKRAALFLVEILGYTLLIQAIGGILFGLQLPGFLAPLGVWFGFGLAVLLLAWVFNRIRRGQGWRELGFRFHQSFGSDLGAGVCGFALINFLSLPLDVAARRDRAQMAQAILGQLHFSTPLQIILGGSLFAVLLGFFTGAFHEEIRFRGYYQGAGSTELTPLAGLILALIPFSLGHYFAQTHWSAVQVAATILPGVVYGLLYHATRSLTVVITAHTLTNWLPFHAFLLSQATGNPAVSLAAIAALALVSLVLLAWRWDRELREWREAARRLLAQRPAFGLASGLILGGGLLALWAHRFPPLPSALAGMALTAVALAGKKG